MAQLLITSDPLIAGRWSLDSSNPTALAATCDALVQSLNVEGEALAGWGLHNDEQTGLREHAYENELQELGPTALAQVVELPRPYQQNVVWVDRFQLVIRSASTATGSRLLGLYIGSKGSLVIAVHHPSVSALVQNDFTNFPNHSGRDWDSAQLINNCRVLISYSAKNPSNLQVRAPQSMAHLVNDSLIRLSQLVANW